MSLLRSCRTASMQVRGFTSSSRRQVGPESPNFIDVPQTLQPYHPRKQTVKGTLPVPRELFPARRKDKPSKEYLEAATTEPSKQTPIDPNDPHAEVIEQKRKMAEMRRQNLRQGLGELYNRKLKTEAIMTQRSKEKRARRDLIINQPERDDERLTRPSVPQDMMPKWTPVLPDPDRQKRLSKASKRRQKKEAQKENQKRDSLHTLYMNAREFIVNEEQLAAEIDRVFPEGENPAWRSDQQQGENVWNLGAPPGLQSLVYEPKKNETARWDLIQERVKKLGEEVTGGKI
ncbi:hypothetical protein PHISCL_03644 [Aspergillus sclerotialis]|uniref:Uncharacterized protein n=1 Tax=Aspergillus sclerotialis TaxID=2070753 RepID=A0A3A2ZN74_9EURO|nr:hypothetical protein PHISCL_03644 [Aspergillus sclerotialis]